MIKIIFLEWEEKVNDINIQPKDVWKICKKKLFTVKSSYLLVPNFIFTVI